MNIKIRPFYRWYDFYIGLYYDRIDKILYLVFLGFGLKIYRPQKTTVIDQFTMNSVSPVYNDKGEMIGASVAYEPVRWHEEDQFRETLKGIPVKKGYVQYGHGLPLKKVDSAKGQE